MRAAWSYLAAAVACILAGGTAFSLTEHVSLLTGIYWGFTTATTTGYGDVAPHDSAGKLIAIGTMLTAIPLLGNAYQHLHIHRHRKAVAADKAKEATAGGQDHSEA